MVILEFGISLGLKNLLEIKYAESSINKDFYRGFKLNFLSVLAKIGSEISGFTIKEGILRDYIFTCHQELVNSPRDDIDDAFIFYYSLVEYDEDILLIKNLLSNMNTLFLALYSLEEIFSEEPPYFDEFKRPVIEIFGDLVLSTEDKFKKLFFKNYH